MSATNRVRQMHRSAWLVQLGGLLFIGVISVFPVGAGLHGAARGGAVARMDFAFATLFPACALIGWFGGVAMGLAVTGVVQRRARATAAPDAVAWSTASLQDGKQWRSGVLWAAPDGVSFRAGDQTRRWPADTLHDPEIVRDWLRPGVRWRTPDGEVRVSVVDGDGWHAVVRDLAA